VAARIFIATHPNGFETDDVMRPFG